MGCDIHLFIETPKPGGGWIGKQRHYMGRYWFAWALMAEYRGQQSVKFPPRGFPCDASARVLVEAFDRVETPVPQWMQYHLAEYDGPEFTHRGVRYVLGGDWHTFSWLTKAELQEVQDMWLPVQKADIAKRIKEYEQVDFFADPVDAAVAEHEGLKEEALSDFRWRMLELARAAKPSTALLDILARMQDGDRVVFFFDN